MRPIPTLMDHSVALKSKGQSRQPTLKQHFANRKHPLRIAMWTRADVHMERACTCCLITCPMSSCRALEGRFPEPLSVRSNSPTVKGERWVCVIERSTAAKILCMLQKSFKRQREVTPRSCLMVFGVTRFPVELPVGPFAVLGANTKRAPRLVLVLMQY